MADFAKVSLIVKRLIATLALALLVAAMAAPFYPDAVVIVLFLSWAAVFFGWQYLSRKQDARMPKAPPPPPPGPTRPTAWGRIIITGLVAFGVVCAIAPFPISDFSPMAGLLTWIALYYGWPPLSRRLPLPESWKAKARTGVPSTAPKPGFWRFLGRGALALLGIVVVMILIPAMIMAPIANSFVRARRVHDSIRVGMTLPEVLVASRGCDLFGASSVPPYDNAAADSVPTVSVSRTRDGAYRLNDGVAHSGTALTETEAVDRLQAPLHDGYRWRSNCINVNMTSMHVSFSVVFGPDGRVADVTPVHGWD